MERGDKNFTILINNKRVKVSIDRLKPAFVISDDIERYTEESEEVDREIVVETETRISRRDDVTQERPEEATQERHDVVTRMPRIDSENRSGITTRSGRAVRFPDRFQAGFN